MSASARRDGDTTATLDASEWAPPTPSTCIGWPLPITASSSASRSAGSLGRSVARKYRPFEVPPRISMHRTPLISLPPSRALGLGPRWLRAAGPRRRDPATALGAPYAAFGPAPAAFQYSLRSTEEVSPLPLHVVLMVDVLDAEPGQHGAQSVPVQPQFPAAERIPGRALLRGALPCRGEGPRHRRPRDHHHPVVVGQDRVPGHDVLTADADGGVDRSRRGLDGT